MQLETKENHFCLLIFSSLLPCKVSRALGIEIMVNISFHSTDIAAILLLYLPPECHGLGAFGTNRPPGL